MAWLTSEVCADVNARLTDALNDTIAVRAEAPFCHMAAHIRKNKLEKPGAWAWPSDDAALLPEVQAYLDEHGFVRKLSKVAGELKATASLPDDLVGLLAAKVGALESVSLLPLLRVPGFWESESGAPLLGRNAGFLTRGGGVPDSWRARIATWPGLCGVGPEMEPSGACDDDAALRIFEKDADRTFVHATHKQLYIALLQRIWPENRDYNQGLGYTCSLLMLLFDEDTVRSPPPPSHLALTPRPHLLPCPCQLPRHASLPCLCPRSGGAARRLSAARGPAWQTVRILTALTRRDKYTPGYWKAAPDAYVRDAKVRLPSVPPIHPFLHTSLPAPPSHRRSHLDPRFPLQVYGRLLAEREPELAAHLAVCVPESYASKWFNGLCLHVMPYAAPPPHRPSHLCPHAMP
jgi:hypothetical protein